MGQTTGSEGIASEKQKYLGLMGAWALAFGCSVGWGSFVMPGTTFLPIAGPIGTAIGLGLGGLVMLVLAVNYHYLMNRYPDGGGTYTYTKMTFGYDHGFLSAWFLILTYTAIIWANATALPLIARTLLGDTFRVGYLYEIAGYPIYLGELLLAIGALVLAAMACLLRKTAAMVQIIMAVILFVGVIICFAVASGSAGKSGYDPAFSPDSSAVGGVLTIFALAPWAFVGFESISHSAAEAKFNLKKSFRVLVIAVITATIAYVLLSLLAVKALPEGCKSWTDYVGNLDSFSGEASQPTFYAAFKSMGDTGSLILGAAALGAIFTGLIGNYIALSRLMAVLAEDGLVSKWVGRKSNNVPRNAIICILIISAVFPFLGRTAISWIVDVTTVGATIAYALASASAWKTAKLENNRKYKVFGFIGVIISVLFAIEFLIPNILSISTLSTESYLILSIWSICGFLYFRFCLRKDRARRMGKSIVTWVVLLALIIFTSSVWMRQTTDKALERYEKNVQSHFRGADKNDLDNDELEAQDAEFIRGETDKVDSAMHVASLIQVGLVIVSLLILLNIYAIMQKRERMIEVEKARAEETSRAKSSFLSNMSHEIRTPMNAIIGLKNIALRDPDISEHTRDNLEKIGSSADHLLGLINDILDMSRIESGRMSVKDEEFSFQEFINQINVIISGQCQDKHLHYDCKIIGDVEEYYIGDDLKLKQVMINILGNAVKFTDAPGDVVLTVEQLSEEGNKCTMRFIMQDTGVGMDPEFIPKLFETFSQEDVSNTNKYGGSGLGMAITKNLVEMMGGEIQVESKKQEGSKFTVTVPLIIKEKLSKDVEATNEAEVSSGVGAENEVGTTNEADAMTEEEILKVLSDKRILMAEDVDQNAEILADLLDLEDIHSARAKNGEEAVRMFSKSEEGFYAAILMDVRMPVMDGLDATRAIRELNHPDAKKIPIIAMTANVFDEDVERSLEAGMDAHLSKPVEPDKLYETMARLIMKRSEEEVE